ncbi:MAG: ribose 5-phosphate isomerase B [Acidimicrobiia bacterium]|nr:ribose 5-phosphate isomerase B [Acidimicrobiia bacterium]
MRIAVGADHAGYQLKDTVARFLAEQGHAVTDFGTHSEDSVDYPDYAASVANAVSDGRAERGIVVCGSGAGACIAANKIVGVRAMQGTDSYTAHQGVEHDDANVLCLGARVTGEAVVMEVVAAFVGAKFIPEERYVRRLNKVKALEAGR